jgi:lipoyl(octanoyl) transferase
VIATGERHFTTPKVITECAEFRMGVMEYQEAWDLQQQLATLRSGLARDERIPDTVLLLEHPHTYTLGRRSDPGDVLLSESELRERGIAFRWVDRGGQVTYHGPGQLVLYGIVDVRRVGGVASYVCGLEEVVISTLAMYGIVGERKQRFAGVWIGEEKIAAVGVRVSRGITTHGFALNVSPDLDYFRYIIPCGVRGKGVTSMESVLGESLAAGEVHEAISRAWAEVFGFRMKHVRSPRQWLRKLAVTPKS